MSSKMQIPKNCEHCGKSFIARTTTTRFCCNLCSKRAYKLKVRNKKIQDTIIENLNTIHNASNISQNPNSLTNKEYLNITETSQLIGVSRWTIQRMIKRGQLKSVPFGRNHIISRNQIESLFK